VDPGARPVQLPWGEPGRVDAHDHVVFGRVGAGDVGQREPGGAGGPVSYGDRSHNGSLLPRIQVLTRPSGTPGAPSLQVRTLAGRAASRSKPQPPPHGPRRSMRPGRRTG